MPDVGSGVVEVRLHGENEFRVFYVARFEEAVYVLHCFVKKTRATRKADIELGRQRYTSMLELRRSTTEVKK
jgi:phage-related protein